jgi:hypothetical protein
VPGTEKARAPFWSRRQSCSGFFAAPKLKDNRPVRRRSPTRSLRRVAQHRRKLEPGRDQHLRSRPLARGSILFPSDRGSPDSPSSISMCDVWNSRLLLARFPLTDGRHFHVPGPMALGSREASKSTWDALDSRERRDPSSLHALNVGLRASSAGSSLGHLLFSQKDRVLMGEGLRREANAAGRGEAIRPSPKT